MQDVRGHFQTNFLKLLPEPHPFYTCLGDPFGYSLAALFCDIVLYMWSPKFEVHAIWPKTLPLLTLKMTIFLIDNSFEVSPYT